MPRVWDTVIVTSEADLDLLEARFTEYQDLDVTTVIAETPVDWQGKPKPLWFLDNAYGDRFARWYGRWNHVRAEPWELPPVRAGAKARKDALRDYLAHATCAEPSDVVLHGGVDEIPAERYVREVAEDHGTIHIPVAFEMRHCAYRPHLVHPHPWRGTVAQEWRLVGSFAGMREKRLTLPAVVNSGTRLSMLGEELQERHPDGTALWPADVDETWPRWVIERGRQGLLS